MTNGPTPIEETQVPAPPGESVTVAGEALGRKWVVPGLRAFTLSEGNLFLVLAVVIGLFSGMAVSCSLLK